MSKIWIPGGGSGVDLDVITAEAGDVLASKVIVDKEGNPLVGTMPNNGAWSSSNLAAGASVEIPSGYHNGTGKVMAKSLASQTPGNLASNKILANYYGYSNGVKITGNIASQGALTLKPGKTAKTGSVSGKYMTGNITVPAVSIAANVIKKGTRITFPDGSYVDGTFEGYVASPTDLYYKGNNPAGFSASNLSGATVEFQGNQIRIDNDESAAGLHDSCYLNATKAYNFTGYSTFVLEFNAKNYEPYNYAIRLIRSDTEEVIGTNSGFDSGNNSVTFDLSKFQTSFKPAIRFMLSTHKNTLLITRIRIY